MPHVGNAYIGSGECYVAPCGRGTRTSTGNIVFMGVHGTGSFDGGRSGLGAPVGLGHWRGGTSSPQCTWGGPKSVLGQSHLWYTFS